MRQGVPKASEVKHGFPSESRVRSTAKGVMIFFISFVGYCCSFETAASSHQLSVMLVGSIGAFLFMSTLFVVGHDACHGSLTPSSLLNKILGRLSFLPNYHPYSSWEHTHNGLHHGMTNVRGCDPVFVPLSKQEYDSLPRYQRWLQRVYRTTPGLGLYYFWTIWWKLEMFPSSDCRPKGTRAKKFYSDRLLIAAFVAVQLSLITIRLSSIESFSVHLFFAIIFPFILFNGAMGFVIFLHHTHPRVPWYKSKAEFSYFASQVRSSVHAEFPRILELILHNIMDHTAHHADPRIPLYNLHDSQKSLERIYPVEITNEPWTLRGWRQTLSTCRLYDYDRNQWLDYDGKPTTDVLISSRESLEALTTFEPDSRGSL